jgi:Cu+-exporting ATPase
MKKVILLCFLAIDITSGAYAHISKTPAYADSAKVKYTCPMHPEVISDTPGTCPKCGMALVKKKVVVKQYTCGMHPEIISDTPGRCPKCGMGLIEKKQ